MGYYSQFPKAISLLRVSYVRVTHPCATNNIAIARSTCMY